MAERVKQVVFILFCLAGLVSLAEAIDRVRREVRVDDAVAEFGVTGRGVLIAILDRGIDWLNGDFRNDDGTTRIQYIFDLTDDTGANAAGNPYKMGTIYTRDQINRALKGELSLTTRDAVGHGTTTSGIATGNGRNSAERKYRGVAPNASILVVKITSDGAPAHDDQAAEAAFFQRERIPVAIDFVRDKANELGLPCVMLLNLGSIGGPTDGTSFLSRKVDETVGPGKPGLIFVTGAGDDGGGANHAGGTIMQGSTTSINIQKVSAGSLFFDLWYSGDDRFDVTIRTPSRSFGPFTAPDNGRFLMEQNAEFSMYHLGVGRDFYRATNNKRELWIRFDGVPGAYTVQVSGSVVKNGRFDATLNPTFFGQDPNRFLNFLVPGSIWDMATAAWNITPNSYVIRTTWTDIDGSTRTLSNQGNVGELWRGSSTGPTFDGRLGIDVSAPGDRIVTAYNPKSYWATSRFNLINDGRGLYGIAGAVSAADPIVTGIIALMLEVNAQLDAASVKDILQKTARSDSFTGSTPNATWGYGKIDAYAAVVSAIVRGSESSRSYRIANLGGLSLTSDGRMPSVRVGYGRVLPASANTTPAGVAIFAFRVNDVLVSEAGVPASPLVRSGRVHAEVSGPVNTGLAVANPASQDAVLTFSFTDSTGRDFGSGTTTIPAGGQIARFLSEAPFNGAASLQATFTFSSSVPVAVIALRGFTNERGEFLITTLPVADLSSALNEPAYLPHFANGGGWTTQIVLINSTDNAAGGTVQFLGPSGSPIEVSIGGQTGSSFSYSIPRRSSQKFVTSGSGAAIQSGSLRIIPASGRTPTASVIFSLKTGRITVSEAGLAASKSPTFRLYVESSGAAGQPGSIQTGFAITNAAAAPITVLLELTKLDGSPTGLSTSLTLPGSGQVAKFVNEMFPSLPASFQGVLQVSTSSTDGMAVVGLRTRYNERNDFLITTTPPSYETTPPSTTEFLFPHLADGGGYTTQFILFSSTSAASSGTLRLFSQSGAPLILSTRN